MLTKTIDRHSWLRGTWPLCLATFGALFVVGLTSAPARADSNFERGFEDQLGRILAYETVNLGKHVLFQGVFRPSHYGYHDDHHRYRGDHYRYYDDDDRRHRKYKKRYDRVYRPKHTHWKGHRDHHRHWREKRRHARDHRSYRHDHRKCKRRGREVHHYYH